MLLGRDRERAELRRALTDAREGRSSVLALVGEPGIGKSSLLAEAEAGARAAGMRILSARGIESEAHVPFAGLLELLRPALGALDKIPPRQANALGGALALRSGGGNDRFAVGAATLSLLAVYADEAPLLVLVDDAHWLDRSSAGALLFAMRRLVADPIAVVLSVREGEASLLEGARLPLLRLEGLDLEHATRLLGGVSAPVAERLHRATAGNPLALLELASEGESLLAIPLEQPLPISASIAAAFLRRSAGLSSRARDALVLAAASDTGDLTILARAGLRVDDLDEAERAGLVSLAGGRLEFRHPLARSAIYGEALPEQRRAAHRALADALPDLDLDRRAWHLASAAAGPDEAASVALAHAADRARERAAYSVAASAFERAARLNPDDAERGRLLYLAAETAWLAGEAERALILLDEAATFAPEPRIEHLRGEIAARRGPVMEGHDLLLAAAAEASPEDAVVTLAEAADAAFHAGAPVEMLAAAERAEALVEAGAGGQAPFYAAVALGAARVMTGREGATDLRRAVELYELGGFPDDGRSLTWAALTAVFLRDVETEHKLMDRAIERAREHVALGVLPRLVNRLARDESMRDRWAEADADYNEAIRLARETGQRTELAAGLAGLAWFDGRRGREDDCRAHASEGMVLCRELGIGLFELWTHAALGELELGLARPNLAVAHFEAQQARAHELGIEDVDLAPLPELVDCYLRLGRLDEARAAAAGYTARARAKGQPWALARAARCRGLVDDDFEPPFDEALRLHQETPDAFETARTQLAYGATLRRARRRVRAREQLRAALAGFEALGPSPWADTAAAELAATGETARRRDPSTLGDLTPQELQIALLLADGKTTRETAAALFLSPKTIEYHLRSIYRKLGVNSRGALTDAVARQ